MKAPIIIIGIGEMAGVFARGLLRSGQPLYPITRAMDMAAEARQVPEPQAVVLAVAEKDLHPTLEQLPQSWRDRLILLQNELLPRDWLRHEIAQPTVISVWFEKKPGQDFKVLIPSPVYGPNNGIIKTGLEAMNIPTTVLATPEQLEFELVRKNVYILTTNIAGLETGGTVQALWDQHQDFARSVADEVMDIQASLVDGQLERERLIAGMVEAMEADPEHQCTGRSAPSRLQRALGYADQAKLAVPTLRRVWQQHRPSS